MRKEECDTKRKLIANTCCIILSENIRKLNAEQLARCGLIQRLERLLHNLTEKFGIYHIAANLPPDSSHDIICLMEKIMEKHRNVCLYLVGETQIQGIRYGQDSKSVEKGMFPFSDPPTKLKKLPLCEKRMIDRSDHVIMVLPGEEEEIRGELRELLEYAKQQNKNIIKINEKTLQVKAYTRQT